MTKIVKAVKASAFKKVVENKGNTVIKNNFIIWEGVASCLAAITALICQTKGLQFVYSGQINFNPFLKQSLLRSFQKMTAWYELIQVFNNDTKLFLPDFNYISFVS